MSGVLDNYLTDEEKKYFESGGSEVSDKLTEEVAPKEESQDETQVSSDVETQERESTEETQEAADDDIDDEEPTESKKRDYEKAFKTERYKRKELKEALDNQSKKTKELEENLNKLQQAMTTAQQAAIAEQQARNQPKEEVPDPELDPMGYQQYKINQLERSIVEHNKYLQNQYQTNQQLAQQQAFEQTYRNMAQEYSQKQPDFMDAYNHLVKDRMEEYQEAGYTKDEASRLVIEDEMAIAAKAMQDKVNPMERLYKMAQKRGYSSKGQSKDTKKASVKDLEQVKKGMQNSKSLKSGGGEMAERELGLDNIDEMNFQEFDAFWDKFKSQQKRMG